MKHTHTHTHTHIYIYTHMYPDQTKMKTEGDEELSAKTYM